MHPMDLITRLEKRFGNWAIPHLALYLIGLQAIGVIMLLGGYAGEMELLLHGSSVMHRGQWWRMLSFLMLPSVNLSGRFFMLWLFFSFYIFYLMSNALERQWGTFRFNLFILSGYLLTVMMAFINPGVVITNTFFLGCVFLAFATLFPNFELLLFFVFPVKVKWLGWLTAGLYLFVLAFSDMGSRLCVLASLVNYALFFGKGFIGNVRAARRRQAYESRVAETAAQPMHVCSSCGSTDKTDPTMLFRYCSTCGQCFCDQHISDHEH